MYDASTCVHISSCTCTYIQCTCMHTVGHMMCAVFGFSSVEYKVNTGRSVTALRSVVHAH